MALRSMEAAENGNVSMALRSMTDGTSSMDPA